MDDTQRRTSVIAGVLTMGVGLVLLLGQLLHWPSWDWRGLWPAILILVGANKLMHHLWGRNPAERGTGIPVMLVGLVLLLDTQHVASLRQTWPAFIVIAGLAKIFSERADRRAGEVRDDR